jgi:hypothetical protein
MAPTGGIVLRERSGTATATSQADAMPEQADMMAAIHLIAKRGVLDVGLWDFTHQRSLYFKLQPIIGIVALPGARPLIPCIKPTLPDNRQHHLGFTKLGLYIAGNFCPSRSRSMPTKPKDFPSRFQVSGLLPKPMWRSDIRQRPYRPFAQPLGEGQKNTSLEALAHEPLAQPIT